MRGSLLTGRSLSNSPVLLHDAPGLWRRTTASLEIGKTFGKAVTQLLKHWAGSSTADLESANRQAPKPDSAPCLWYTSICERRKLAEDPKFVRPHEQLHEDGRSSQATALIVSARR